MAALTQDRITRTVRGGTILNDDIAIKTSSRIYRGGFVNRLNAGGRAVAATAATGRRLAGLSVGFRGAVGTGLGVAGGTEYVKVERNVLGLVNIKTAIRTTTSLGLNVFVSDDNTVGGTAVGTSAARVVAGTLMRFEASDKSTGWVFVGGLLGAVSIAV